LSAYFTELSRAMEMIGSHPRAVFMGQAVACAGTAMSRTLAGVPKNKLIELPVAEDMQMGMAIGAAMNGDMPVCIYPRFNFLLLAMSQLVLHLDKLPLYSRYRPRVIIRTAIATPDPLDPGPQHLGDYTEAFELMLTTVVVRRLDDAARIVPEYMDATQRLESTLLVERTELYT
jgi:pyruvate/2-oxoglutarate/acetoin dehydrogenase E1 component